MHENDNFEVPTISSASSREMIRGKKRNEMEALRLQGVLENALKHRQHGRKDEALRLVFSVQRNVGDILNALTPFTPPVYASLQQGKDYQTGQIYERSHEEALAVAAANVRRAVNAGDVGHAQTYLTWIIDRIKGG